jgi:hypothetical protein
LASALAAVVQHAEAVGGEVLDATRRVKAAYEKQRGVIAASALAKQPPMAELQQLLQPVADEMVAAGQLADNRRSAAFQQLKVVAESLNGLSWLAYTGPACGEPRANQNAGFHGQDGSRSRVRQAPGLSRSGMAAPAMFALRRCIIS